MLCNKCWLDAAAVRFASISDERSFESALCLACAQRHPLSWLLAWAYRQAPRRDGRLARPVVVRARAAGPDGNTLQHFAATGLVQCACGCRIATAVEMPCQHEAYAFEPGGHAAVHLCHCGEAHRLVVPRVACRRCGASSGRAFIATAHTCHVVTRGPALARHAPRPVFDLPCPRRQDRPKAGL